MKLQIEEIRKVVYETIENIIEEYELPPVTVTDDTLLINTLGLNSIDITHLLTSIDMRLAKHLPYEELVMKEGIFVSDFSVKEIIDFIVAKADSVDFELGGEPQDLINN